MLFTSNFEQVGYRCCLVIERLSSAYFGLRGRAKVYTHILRAQLLLIPRSWAVLLLFVLFFCAHAGFVAFWSIVFYSIITRGRTEVETAHVVMSLGTQT